MSVALITVAAEHSAANFHPLPKAIFPHGLMAFSSPRHIHASASAILLTHSKPGVTIVFLVTTNEVIKYLKSNPGTTPKQCADALRADPAVVSNLFNQLALSDKMFCKLEWVTKNSSVMTPVQHFTLRGEVSLA